MALKDQCFEIHSTSSHISPPRSHLIHQNPAPRLGSRSLKTWLLLAKHCSLGDSGEEGRMTFWEAPLLSPPSFSPPLMPFLPELRMVTHRGSLAALREGNLRFPPSIRISPNSLLKPVFPDRCWLHSSQTGWYDTEACQEPLSGKASFWYHALLQEGECVSVYIR